MPSFFLLWTIPILLRSVQISAPRLAIPVQVLAIRLALLGLIAAPLLLHPTLVHEIVNLSPVLANASRLGGSIAGGALLPLPRAVV